MKRFFESILEINGYMLLLGIIASYSLITYLTYELIITDDRMYDFFASQFPEAHLERIMETQKKSSWFIYPFRPIVILVKWLFISAFLSAGALLSNVKIDFARIYKTVMWGEFIFIAASTINLVVLFHSNIQSLEQINSLAISNRMSVGTIIKLFEGPEWLSTPFYALNIEAVLFTIFLVVSFGLLVGETIKENLKWIIGSYCSYLFLWIILLTYLNVTYA